MATKTFKGRIQNKHDTEANWNAAVNFRPLAGELIIYDEDNAHSTPRFKVGDGNTLVNNLPFYPSGDVTAAGNNVFTGSTNKFTQKPTFSSGFYLGLTAPKVNDLWEIETEGFKAAGRSISTQTIKFPDFSNFEATTHTIPLNDTDNTFTGTNTFNNSTGTEFCTSVKAFSASAPLSFIKVTSNNFIKSNMTGSSSSVQYTMSLPDKDGTIALTSDIPDVATFAKLAQDNTFTGMTNTFTNQVDLQGLVRIGKGNSITILSSTSTGLVNVKLPSKKGTLALTDDIPIKSATLDGTTLSITLS